ncbi:MAG: sulfotransferase [Candidatus Thermoplasmatota archaeon]
MKLISSLVNLAWGLGLRIWELNRDAILSRAKRKTGLDNFGNDNYIKLMDRLIDNVKRAGLTPLGTWFIHFVAQKTAVNRLYIEDYIEKHPEVEDIPIKSPIFIVGFPRTGTTLLQNVLSLGPGYRALYLWELATPYPVHEDREKDRRMRMNNVEIPLRLIKMGVPALAIVHDARVDTKEECWILLANTLGVVTTDLITGLHEWNDWLMAMDRKWVYEEYKRMLQIQAHLTPTERFVLKCPTHLWNLEPILKTFPDAYIVWAHRNPIESIASFSNLAYIGRRIFLGYADTRRVGEMVEERFHSGVKDAMKFRERIGNSCFYDVNFEILVKDIPGAVKNIKKHFDLEHSKEADKAVREFLAQPRKDTPGKHVYSPEQFGLNPIEIVERFEDYIERFDIKINSAT